MERIESDIVPYGEYGETLFHDDEGWEHIEGAFTSALSSFGKSAKKKLSGFGKAVKKGAIHVAKGKQGSNDKYTYILFVNKNGRETGVVQLGNGLSVEVDGGRIVGPKTIVGRKGLPESVQYPALLIVDEKFRLHLVASTVAKKPAYGDQIAYHMSPVGSSTRSRNFITSFLKESHYLKSPRDMEWTTYIEEKFEKKFGETTHRVMAQINDHQTLDQL